VGAQAGIANSLKKEGQAVIGTPAFDFLEAARSMAAYKNLGDLVKRVNQLESELKKLKEK
jgi:UDP-3-O-[3-hydroxymyristoyl] glucosamine N-acyltransferase